MKDAYLKKMKDKVEARLNTQFTLREDSVLMIGKHMCISDNGELKKQIMNEAHTTSYAIHPSSTKMYRDLKSFYWWPAMKRNIAEFVVRCSTC